MLEEKKAYIPVIFIKEWSMLLKAPWCKCAEGEALGVKRFCYLNEARKVHWESSNFQSI